LNSTRGIGLYDGIVNNAIGKREKKGRGEKQGGSHIHIHSKLTKDE